MNTIKIQEHASNPQKTVGIYCHIPFFLKKCAYCDIASFSCLGEEKITDYFKALYQEIKNFAAVNIDSVRPVVDTIYFGGGTPSSVAAEHIEKTLLLLR